MMLNERLPDRPLDPASTPDRADFGDLVRRVRAGDDQAAAELVRQYEPAVRLEVRLRLRDSRLRRNLDSLDVCQSVLASFFVRAAAGQYDLEGPGQLLKLLVTIVRNKVASRARREQAECRDHRRIDPGAVEALEVVDAAPGPSRLAAAKELLHEFRRRLTEEERRLADLRAEGHAWTEIAAEMGGTPDGRRMQLSRAAQRVGRLLGLDDVNHE